ncbi:hypothetical protein Plim_2662 [Planctopirus limnophila DSM 3776]|uniref:Uncharacterized protein n=1 Tax=Planctopirus limnophila (strain ATCC 43296 / DSM 3776 / IFAM 1008 / Mu 290) TaxID=521674 RepID=D5SQM3_PLAL2|nr:hypothetical protein Plim_2662 [Planctopirus limnophila DSM 3776]
MYALAMPFTSEALELNASLTISAGIGVESSMQAIIAQNFNLSGISLHMAINSSLVSI